MSKHSAFLERALLQRIKSFLKLSANTIHLFASWRLGGSRLVHIVHRLLQLLAQPWQFGHSMDLKAGLNDRCKGRRYGFEGCAVTVGIDQAYGSAERGIGGAGHNRGPYLLDGGPNDRAATRFARYKCASHLVEFLGFNSLGDC